MKRRVFVGLGATSIAAGALHSIGAFSSLSAGRGVAVSAADDATALLGIKNANDEADPPEFTNRTGHAMEIEFDPEEDDVTFDGEDADSFTLELPSEESEEVEIESESSGLIEIEVTATLFDGAGDPAGSIELSRDFGVPQSENIVLTAEVTGVGNSGQFDFEIENEGSDSVTIDAVAIADATVNDDEDPVEVDDEFQDRDGDSDAPGPLDVLGRELEDEDDEEWVLLNETLTLNIGDTNEFRARSLVDEDGNNARYNNGGTLDVSFRFGDGSIALLKMEEE